MIISITVVKEFYTVRKSDYSDQSMAEKSGWSVYKYMHSYKNMLDLFIKQSFSKQGLKGNILNLIKATCLKPATNIILTEKLWIYTN